jgi:hypothetical protein
MAAVDRAARTATCELLRHLVAGQITNDQFADHLPLDSTDPAIHAVRQQAWVLYSDLREHRLVARDRDEGRGRDEVARWIIFLQSDLTYEWPTLSHGRWQLLFLADLLSATVVGRLRVARFKKHGDFEVWPFLRESDYRAALANPRYLNGQ